MCNVKEKKKVDPEMVELAKYAKHHVPEEHEKVTSSVAISPKLNIFYTLFLTFKGQRAALFGKASTTHGIRYCTGAHRNRKI
jgi:hypothetical protein